MCVVSTVFAAPPTPVGFCDNAGARTAVGTAVGSEDDNDAIVCIDDDDVVGIAVVLVVEIGEVVVAAGDRDGVTEVVVSCSDCNAATRFRISNATAWISAALALGGAVASLRIAFWMPSRRITRDSLTSL